MTNIRQFLKKLSWFIIDPYTYTSERNWAILALRTIRYRLAGKGLPITVNERKLLNLRNRYVGERIFILGNGPSLNRCDLKLLINEYTFGVNNIFLNFNNMGFFTTFYCVEDIFVAEDRSNEINSLWGPIKFFGNYLKYCLDNNPNTIWTNTCINYSEYSGFPNFSKNASRIIWVGGTVSYICLQLAFYMGFSKVYLIGFDHNYKIPNNSVFIDNCGEEILSTSDDPNHFNPDYFGSGYRWHHPRVERMEKAFRNAKAIYEQDNREIINATVGGYLEVFSRVNYKELF